LVFTTPKLVPFSTEDQLKRAEKTFSICLSLLLFSFSVLPVFSQAQSPDKSKKAALFEQQALKFSAQEKFDSVEVYLFEAKAIHEKMVRRSSWRTFCTAYH
jgi:hypothetical protein